MIIPMSPKEILDGLNWQTLLTQGVSTVLLFLIVIGVYQATPRILDKVESGYQKNSEELQKAALVYQQANERLLQHMIDESKLRNDMLKSEIEDKDGI